MHCLMSAQVGIQLPISSRLMAVIRCSTLIITSLMAKSPTITLMKLTPAISSTEPKVSRAAPVSGSWPIRAASSPRAMEIDPLQQGAAGEADHQAQPHEHQGEVLRRAEDQAKSASIGAKKVSPTRLSVPATKEEMAEMARAGPALPCLAIS